MSVDPAVVPAYAEGMETSREYNVVIAPQPEGGFTAFVPALPDVVSGGRQCP